MNVKIFDHSQYYASVHASMLSKSPDIISPMDTSQTRKKNPPAFSLPHSQSSELFNDLMKSTKHIPGPGEYNQDDRAIRNARNTQVTIPHEAARKSE